MKTIIAICDPGVETETARELTKYLMEQYPTSKPLLGSLEEVNPKNDFSFYIEIDRKLIGVYGQNGPQTHVVNRLDGLISNCINNCDLVYYITPFMDITGVEEIANNYGYDILYPYNFTPPKNMKTTDIVLDIIGFSQQLGIL